MQSNAPIGNYYGTPYVYDNNGKYFIAIEDYDGVIQEEISKEFFDAWIKEFKDKKYPKD